MMRYLVQYMVGRERKSAAVQASSPQEAAVKLQHTRSGRDDHRGGCQILSIMPEAADEEACPEWPARVAPA